MIADPEVNRYVAEPTDRTAKKWLAWASAWRQIAMFMGHRELRGWTSSASPAVENATKKLSPSVRAQFDIS